MVRVRIVIENSSPFLKVFSGVMYVELVNTVPLNEPIKQTELFRCKIRKENGSLGYQAFETKHSIPSKLFECVKPITNQMIKSYWHGMTLSDGDYCWIATEGDDSFLKINQLDDEVSNHLSKLIRKEKE